ncbi:hypothetical protein J1N35_001107 [Gossypium stocksii]|uniref:Uncharacterized protein n=1 Tax=Gossypium stocksii TaxID=47602 RepID=A0A9D3WI94_9ROSI|nr:hypothetical protein J1N35_001107 [Gossypium stocksii]
MMLRMRIMLSRLGNRIWGMFCPVIFALDAIIYFKNLNLCLLLLIRDDKLAFFPADPLILGDYAFSYLQSQEFVNIADRWFDGLITKDIEITNELFSVSSIDFDRQELRKLVRRVQTSQEQIQNVREEDKAKIEVIMTIAKKSLTRFLRILAKQLTIEESFD